MKLAEVCEEFAPLLPGETVFLTDGTTGSIWSERLKTADAEVVASFADGPAGGGPALTRRSAGAGAAWFVATQPDRIAYRDLVARLAADAGVALTPGASRDVEIVRRSGENGSYLFVINHGDTAVEISATGHDLVTDAPASGRVPAGAVRIIKEDA